MLEKYLIENGWDEAELQLLENIGDIYFELGSNRTNIK